MSGYVEFLVPLDRIVRGERDRLEMGDLGGLAESIRTVGLLHPVVVTADFRLVAGDRRLAAVRDLGWREVPVTMVDVTTAAEVMRAEQDENACRKSLTPAEAERAFARRKAILAPAAAQRRGHGKTAPGRPLPDAPDNLAGASIPETRTTAAIGTGYAPATLSKVSGIREIAQEGILRNGDRVVPAPPSVQEAAREAMAALEKPGASVDALHRAVAEAIAASDAQVARERARKAWQAALAGTRLFREHDLSGLPELLSDAEWDAAALVVDGLVEQVELFRAVRPSALRVVAGAS